MTTMPSLSLPLTEVAELGELLELVGDWLGGAPPAVAASFADFIGSVGYDLCDLRADCRRWAFVVGVAESPFVDGDQL